jgi:purine-binding chemotaxis protein CheW
MGNAATLDRPAPAATATPHQAADRRSGHDRRVARCQYLFFSLAAEEYGLPVLKVREIIKMMSVTPVPQSPAHVKGVINLRGTVIPVSDLRVRFGAPAREYDERTCIIVIEVDLGSSKSLLGVVVDVVSEVVGIGADEIEPTPDFGDHVHTEFLRGIATVKGKVKLLLDPDRVFGMPPAPQ